ncbi:MAG: VWA domain-containing protein [Kiritimatiellae bacterium]|nr:VWA domain-containing protein [Kiritimatiellia bacterium]
MSFGVAWPLCFLLFAPLALAAWRMLRRGRHAGIKFAPVRRLPAKTAGWRARVANLSPWFFLAGAALLVVAAARPRTSLAHSSRSVDAIAIAMAVDVSGSMEALDFSPNMRMGRTRLDVVKDLFAKFVEARPDDLIGLVTFGGYASTRVPLTADHEMLRRVLEGVQVPSIAYDANGRPIDPEETLTAIGDGLATAIARVKDAEMKSKIVILLSDGVSNTGAVEPDAAAAAAAKLGIRVYTIGVGTRSSRTPFKVRDMAGRSVIRYADMSFDESQLKSIAAKTGARYFGVRDEDGLKAALEEIDSLEKTTLDRTVYQRWNEYFPWFLLPGAFLVLTAVSLQMAASRRLV